MLLKVMTWNLGSGIYDDKYYKGINRNFFTKRKIILNNAREQINIIKNNNCDVLLLQEVSKFYIKNAFVNQYKFLKHNLLDYKSYFSNNKFLFNFIIEGKATFTKMNSYSYNLYLPYKTNNVIDNKTVSNRNQVVTRMQIKNKEIVIFNIHLAPYSRLKDYRDKQLQYILNIANKEMLLGNYVIIGGDFNMNISNIKTNLKYSISNNSTNRDLNKRYTKDSKMNYYDGFMYSNNIKLNCIENIYNFMYSDHAPLIAEFELKEN